MARATLSNTKISLADAADPKWHSLSEEDVHKQTVLHIRDAMKDFVPEDMSVPLIANPQSSTRRKFNSAAQANAFKMKQIGLGFLPGQADLIIPLSKAHRWPVLALEIKRYNKSPFTRNGELRKDEHVLRQARFLSTCQHLGWPAYFTVGLEQTLKTFYAILDNEDVQTVPVQVPYKCKYTSMTKSFCLQRLTY